MIMKPVERPTSAWPLKLVLFLIIAICTAIGALMMISVFLFIRPLPSSKLPLSIVAAKHIEQQTLHNAISNISANHSGSLMMQFMRSIYETTITSNRKKRQLNRPPASFSLSDDLHSIVSLPNRGNHTTYYFIYNSSLENLTHLDLVLPVKHFTNSARIHIQSSHFDLLFNQPFQLHNNWLKINLTQYIQSFPIAFQIHFFAISLHSPAFLALYFRRTLPSALRYRRDLLPSSDDDEQYTTNPTDPSACQVRPLRTTFAELNWTSWIVEPSSYEMNICSGICETRPSMPSYFKMQHLLHRLHPDKLPMLCCKPKRFSSTILLYYDGSNLILKRHENMRVIECGCS